MGLQRRCFCCNVALCSPQLTIKHSLHIPSYIIYPPPSAPVSAPQWSTSEKMKPTTAVGQGLLSQTNGVTACHNLRIETKHVWPPEWRGGVYRKRREISAVLCVGGRAETSEFFFFLVGGVGVRGKMGTEVQNNPARRVLKLCSFATVTFPPPTDTPRATLCPWASRRLAAPVTGTFFFLSSPWYYSPLVGFYANRLLKIGKWHVWTFVAFILWDNWWYPLIN